MIALRHAFIRCWILLLCAGPGHALTQPIDGAVALPAGADLRLPFPADHRVAIIAGYGPAMGSDLHRDTNRGDKANDQYALDLNYADEEAGGLGLPVVAALPGEVIAAGWGSDGWANFGLRVYLRSDLGDGHLYTHIYAHLNALGEGIEPGAMVARGQRLGDLGRSCRGALQCGSFNTPHLHWALHRNSGFGGSGSGGSFGGNAVVPEPMDGREDLARNVTFVSSNDGAPPVCGDGRCNGEEDGASCPDDCPVCAPVPAEGRVIDDADECFETGGDPQYLRSVGDAGFAGGLVWTHAVAGPVDNFAVWRLSLQAAGRYRVEVYTDRAYAQSRQANYRLRHGGRASAVVLDQSAADGWRDLGDFDFAAGGDQWLRLEDATGEDFGLRRQIVFDAIRLRPLAEPRVDAGVQPDAGPPRDAALRDARPPGGEVRVGDAGLSADTRAEDTSRTPEPDFRLPEASLPGTDEGPADLGGEPAEGDLEGGCACATNSRERPAAPTVLLGVLIGLGLRRRSV